MPATAENIPGRKARWRSRSPRFVPVKEIAQIGATIGREFSWELIAAVAPQARPFKHALHYAAYDSLLRARRQGLHIKIARVIEERWPDTAATEPELLAHHYTEAKQPDKAIPLWQKAGSLALGRMALAEAIAHLNRGLELAAALPPTVERDPERDDRRQK
jgi:predicted ATPase